MCYLRGLAILSLDLLPLLPENNYDIGKWVRPIVVFVTSSSSSIHSMHASSHPLCIFMFLSFSRKAITLITQSSIAVLEDISGKAWHFRSFIHRMATAGSSSSRIKEYKSRGASSDDGRKKRQDDGIQLRKSKREEQVNTLVTDRYVATSTQLFQQNAASPQCQLWSGTRFP